MPKTLAKLSAVITMALVALYSEGNHLWIGRKIWPSIDELFSDGNPDPVDPETKNIIHRKLLQVRLMRKALDFSLVLERM